VTIEIDSRTKGIKKKTIRQIVPEISSTIRVIPRASKKMPVKRWNLRSLS